MTLYHGTNTFFDTIDLNKSKPNKDFGKGFYLSAEYDQAMAMAKIKVEQLGSDTPTVLAYDVDETLMDTLKVLRLANIQKSGLSLYYSIVRTVHIYRYTIMTLFSGQLQMTALECSCGNMKHEV